MALFKSWKKMMMSDPFKTLDFGDLEWGALTGKW